MLRQHVYRSFRNRYGFKGNIYIADKYNYCVRKLDVQGNVSTIAGTGGTPGNVNETGTNILFGAIHGLAIDNADNIFISDLTILPVKKISAANHTVSSIAGQNRYKYKSKYIDGKSSIASFKGLNDSMFDPNNDLWIADGTNSAIRKITGINTTVTTAVIDLTRSNRVVQSQLSYPNPTINILHFDQERSYEINNNNSMLILLGKNNYVDISALTAGFF